MRKIVILAAIAAGIAGLTGTAFAHGGGPIGGRYWLQHNQAYNLAHPVKAENACLVDGATIVQAQPCANGQLG